MYSYVYLNSENIKKKKKNPGPKMELTRLLKKYLKIYLLFKH